MDVPYPVEISLVHSSMSVSLTCTVVLVGLLTVALQLTCMYACYINISHCKQHTGDSSPGAPNIA